MADKHCAHQTDEAYVISLCEDFCKSPSAPVGYMISQKLDMSTLVCGTVNGCGTPVLNMSSRITSVTGNEAGCGGGVVSGVNIGMCRPVDNYASKVRAEGQCILRHDTIMEMNCAGPEGVGNVKGKIQYLKNGSDSSSSSQMDEIKRKAVKHIKDALDKSGGDVEKAHADIQRQRRASQAASDDKSLIYAHYWLKGRGMSEILGPKITSVLGGAYLFSKKHNLKFDKLAQIGESPWEPSPYDSGTDDWFNAGVEGNLPNTSNTPIDCPSEVDGITQLYIGGPCG